ncbi:MAG: hypothetical protein EPN17_09500 [Methylobacter sp.]|nr:MAG: hypothetical protein EPN17_09500 [Methylobacter sp.]
MKIAIMQPYLFPYIGYFQLLNAVDKFVFYDDVSFIKQGWINRNRLLISGVPRYFTIPISRASATKEIKDILISKKLRWQNKLSNTLYHSYSKAAYYPRINCLFNDVILANECFIAEMAKHSIIAVAEYLGINASFISSSSQYHNAELKGVNRILDICRQENADIYLNLPGGCKLYDHSMFARFGIELQIIQPSIDTYKQFNGAFHPGLSILDVLMFNHREACSKMLGLQVT